MASNFILLSNRGTGPGAFAVNVNQITAIYKEANFTVVALSDGLKIQTDIDTDDLIDTLGGAIGDKR